MGFLKRDSLVWTGTLHTQVNFHSSPSWEHFTYELNFKGAHLNIPNSCPAPGLRRHFGNPSPLRAARASTISLTPQRRLLRAKRFCARMLGVLGRYGRKKPHGVAARRETPHNARTAAMAIDILDLLGEAELPAEVTASGPATLRLRQSHHFLARTLAEGRSVTEAAALTGYSPSRIYTLRDDPAFEELFEHYRLQTAALALNWEDRIGALAGSFLDELQHRLEEHPESFSNKELREGFSALADRSVAPSKAKGAGVPGGTGAGGVAIKISFVNPPPAPQGCGAVHEVLELSPAMSG